MCVERDARLSICKALIAELTDNERTNVCVRAFAVSLASHLHKFNSSTPIQIEMKVQWCNQSPLTRDVRASIGNIEIFTAHPSTVGIHMNKLSIYEEA
jgi:hypothetical protein